MGRNGAVDMLNPKTREKASDQEVIPLCSNLTDSIRWSTSRHFAQKKKHNGSLYSILNRRKRNSLYGACSSARQRTQQRWVGQPMYAFHKADLILRSE